MRQMISVIMSFLALFGFGAGADEKNNSSVPSSLVESCGEGLTWEVDKNGILLISGEGRMLDWEETDKVPWSKDWRDIEAVIVEEGVTYLGSNSFSGLYNMEKISISDTVIGIGDYAFSTCTALEEVTIPDSVTKIGEAAFMGSGVRRVRLSSKLTALSSGIFFGCSDLEEVFLPSSLEEADFICFDDCPKMTKAGVGDGYNFRMDGMKIIPEKLFYNLSQLTEVSIPPSVKTIEEGAFCGTGLTELVIPKGLESLDKFAFSGIPDLSKVTVEEGVVELGFGAFVDCPKLEKVILPSTLAVCDYPFVDCPLLSSAGPGEEFSIELGQMERIPDGLFFECIQLKKAVLPETVTSIGASAFVSSGLVEITLPEGLVEIESNAFQECKNLTRVYYGGTETQRKEILLGRGNDLLYDVEIEYKK